MLTFHHAVRERHDESQAGSSVAGQEPAESRHDSLFVPPHQPDAAPQEKKTDNDGEDEDR
jgi:hypothetical protein